MNDNNKVLKQVSDSGNVEITLVSSRKAYCRGQDDISHPGVYINLPEKSECVKCRYCGKIFMFDKDGH